jgi:polysaccharide biosynthesis/export protein
MKLVLAFCCLAAAAPAQIRLHPMEEAGKENLPAQRLGAGDLIAVSVYDSPELTRTVRVEDDGTIHLPLLKNGVDAAGGMPRDIETRVAEALVGEQILVDPVVKVTVVEYHSRPISVMGAVRKPVTFQAVGAVTLLDALARAEGIMPEAGTEIVLTRASGDGADQPTVERVPVSRLINQADPAVNFALHGGEEIRVPEAGKIFVVGNVRRPGAFPVRDTDGQTVLKLVALSEGLLPFSGKIAYVYRADGSGVKQEIPVELERIMQRKAPDFALNAEDILYVPDNTKRRNTMMVIDRVTSFGANTASGVVIWRR